MDGACSPWKYCTSVQYGVLRTIVHIHIDIDIDIPVVSRDPNSQRTTPFSIPQPLIQHQTWVEKPGIPGRVHNTCNHWAWGGGGKGRGRGRGRGGRRRISYYGPPCCTQFLVYQSCERWYPINPTPLQPACYSIYYLHIYPAENSSFLPSRA